MKDILFIGGSLDDLRAFPRVARQRGGYQLHLVQSGLDPLDWKPMADIGPGRREIRIRDSDGTYRIFYVATIGDTVYVLHCFEKKSQRVPRPHLDLGKQRYKQMTELTPPKP